jgi:hypothetical protein
MVAGHRYVRPEELSRRRLDTQDQQYFEAMLFFRNLMDQAK